MLGVCIGMLGGGRKIGHIFFFYEGVFWGAGGRNIAEKWHRDKIVGQQCVKMIRVCVACVKGAAEWVLPQTWRCKGVDGVAS